MLVDLFRVALVSRFIALEDFQHGYQSWFYFQLSVEPLFILYTCYSLVLQLDIPQELLEGAAKCDHKASTGYTWQVYDTTRKDSTI